ncbi:hypothetical protein [Neptuniibacter sp.]|uniref:hypothetical protein n=1 Tax=Neptuniibacter sp. TaxID=1962643 RepID=UPI00262B5372|nr:hypothetical protein [Neptuniibacter sp.]MCP4597142.1 hypothetical protein [Neptuniibacter sp.]
MAEDARLVGTQSVAWNQMGPFQMTHGAVESIFEDPDAMLNPNILQDPTGGQGGNGDPALESEAEDNDDENQDSEITGYLNSLNDVIGEYYFETARIADFNFPIAELDLETLETVLRQVFSKLQGRQIVLSLEVGYLLKHSLTNELRYFFASWNTILGNRKFAITVNNDSLNQLLAFFRNVDLQNYLTKHRMSSPWVLVRPTNLRCIAQFPFRSDPSAKERKKGNHQ